MPIFYDIDLDLNQTVDNLNFGIFELAEIRGIKWNDRDGDGVYEPLGNDGVEDADADGDDLDGVLGAMTVLRLVGRTKGFADLRGERVVVPTREVCVRRDALPLGVTVEDLRALSDG